MAKVARAKGVSLLACLANLIVVDDAHTRVKQTIHDGFIDRVCVRLCDLSHRSVPNFIGSKDAKLDTFNTRDTLFTIERKFFVQGHNNKKSSVVSNRNAIFLYTQEIV